MLITWLEILGSAFAVVLGIILAIFVAYAIGVALISVATKIAEVFERWKGKW